jgi:hypothetical protein
METYSYNFEIRRMILHFMSAIDGGLVKRYDKDLNVVDSIKVNYVYGPKERIMRDLVDKAEHIKLPIVAVMIKDITRDENRIKDKIVGRYDEMLNQLGGTFQIPAPVPVNITFDVSIMAKYQMDMEQILTNFIPHSDPYFIISWQEPFTKKEIRSKVEWSGSISHNYPEELQSTEAYSRYEASTSFTFEGYIFKERAIPVGTICKIYTDYVLTDKFFCDYDKLVEYAATLPTESFVISGAPRVEWCDPLAIKTGATMSVTCSGDEISEVIGQTKSISIEGWFPKIDNIFLSASNSDMFGNISVSAFDLFPDSDIYPPFDGILIQSFFQPKDVIDKISFEIPSLSSAGFVDVIVSNSCGYSKLSQDRRTLTTCCENPYNPSHPMYDMWEAMQDPFVNGVEVIQTSYECVSADGEGINLLGTVGGKVIKTLGDFYMIEI